MAAAAILENRKIAISRPRFDQFWPNLGGRRISNLLSCRLLKIWNLKNPRWRRPPSWKIDKSPYLGCVLTDFDQIWHGDALPPSWAVWPLKISNFKNPQWRRPPSWKIENWKIEKSPYVSYGLTDRHQIWRRDACWSSLPFLTVKKSKFWNSKMAAADVLIDR